MQEYESFSSLKNSIVHVTWQEKKGGKKELVCILANWPLKCICLTIKHFLISIDLALDTFLHNFCFHNTYSGGQELLKKNKTLTK